MASGVKELFFHQLTSAVAMVRPVETSCSSSARFNGQDTVAGGTEHLIGQRQCRAAVRASVAGEILHFFMEAPFSYKMVQSSPARWSRAG